MGPVGGRQRARWRSQQQAPAMNSGCQCHFSSWGGPPWDLGSQTDSGHGGRQQTFLDGISEARVGNVRSVNCGVHLHT